MTQFASRLLVRLLCLAPLLAPGGVWGVDFPTAAPAASGAARAGAPNGGVRPLSQYGQIQNVQSYSSNPFYNENSPYNLRLPVPVHVQGTELNAAECRAAVAAAVARQCGMANNCAGAKLSDIRPAVMQSLAAMPGHNYMSACGGYVDAVFAEYMARGQNLSGAAAFPDAHGAPNAPKPEFKIENPYALQLTTFKKGYLERYNELDALQGQNADDTTLRAQQMPKVFNDLTFNERNKILAAGYQEWQCDEKTGRGCAYQKIKVETNEERYLREAREQDAITAKLKAEQEAAKAKSDSEKIADPCAWCKKNENKCFQEFSGSAAATNKSLRDAACAEIVAANMTEKTGVESVRLVRDEQCGWKQEVVTITVNASECAGTNRNDPPPDPLRDRENTVINNGGTTTVGALSAAEKEALIKLLLQANQ